MVARRSGVGRREIQLLVLALLVCILMTEGAYSLAAKGKRKPGWLRWTSHDSLSESERRVPRPLSKFRLGVSLDQEPFVPFVELPWDPVLLTEELDPQGKFTGFFRGGFRMVPNMRGRSVEKTREGRVLYDVELTTDALGRRTSYNPHPERRHQYLAVFGCSFAFGEGVREDQTLPSQLAKFAPGYHTYNYAVPGAGPFRIMRDLLVPGLRQEIPEKNGLGIYLFIDAHIRRMTPSLSFVPTKPPDYFEPDASGSFQRYPSYAAAHPILGSLYWLLSQSWILEHYGFEFPAKLTKSDYRSAAKLLREMSNTYERRFGNDRFYVVLFPEPDSSGYMPALLEEAGVKYLDYETINLGLLTRGHPTQHPKDGHPSAEALALVAKHIAMDLGLTDSSHSRTALSKAPRRSEEAATDPP